jgi:hypothetical protein
MAGEGGGNFLSPALYPEESPMSTVCATRSRFKPACLPPIAPGLIVYLVTSTEHVLGHGLRLAPLVKRVLATAETEDDLTIWEECGSRPSRLLGYVRFEGNTPVLTWL